MFKKAMLVLGGFFGFLILVALLAPMFIDANKYRPQIEKVVEENLNADLDLGKLSFSLWGGVHIGVEKMILSEKGSGGKKPIFAMTDARFEIPILSVFSGKPDITVVVKKPEIHVVVGQDGKLNVSKLSKGAAAPADDKAAPAAKAGGSPGMMNLPFKLSFSISDGLLEYADQKKNTMTQIKGFDFDLKHLTFNSPFEFMLKANLDVKEMKELTLRGPVVVKGTAAIYLKSDGLERVEFLTDVDMTGLVLKYAGLFNKDDKVPLKVGVTLKTTDKNFNLERGHFQMGDAAVDATGTVDNFDAPVVNMTVSSTKFIFENWQQILAPLKDMNMKGTAGFNVKVQGPVSKLNFQGEAKISDASLTAPGLVQSVTDMKAKLNFSNDTASVSDTSLKIGASDIAVDGTVKNFSKPIIVFNVKSKLLDVDAMLPKKTPEQEKAEAAQAEAEAKNPKAEIDVEKTASGPIAAMKKNPVMRGLDFTGKMNVGMIRVHKADISELSTELTFKELVMSLKKASAKAFAGSMNINSTIDFRGRDPVYQAAGEIAGLDVNAAVTSQMPPMKDSVFGKIFSKFSINGAGLSKAKVNQNLKGSGNFRLEKGTWSALKVMEQVGEKLKSIPGAKDKLGGVNITGKFRQLKSDFNIAGGKFNIVNMIADMEEANTALTGQGFVDFDMNMALNGKILTPVGGKIPQDLRAADGRLSLPYEVACKATSPCLKMEGAAGVIAKAYLKEEGMGAAKKALEKVDNPVVKDLLKKLPF